MKNSESERTAMSTPANQRRQQPGTYAMQGEAANEEHHRLQIQDQMITDAMGGVLPEQSDLTGIERVLDIGCGAGYWLIETARTTPSVCRLAGIDINPKMIEAARAQVTALGLDDRVQFHQMDAQGRLDFPDESFNLVNERSAMSWLRTWDWPKFLQECQRVTRPGGVVRLTESNVVIESSSSALTRLGQLTIQASYQAGHLFTPQSAGLTDHLVPLMRKLCIQDIQTRVHVLPYRAGTRAGLLFAEDWEQLYRVFLPFLRQWTQVPDDYEQIYQQMLHEMQQPDFVVTMHLLTAWGTRPPHFSRPSTP